MTKIFQTAVFLFCAFFIISCLQPVSAPKYCFDGDQNGMTPGLDNPNGQRYYDYLVYVLPSSGGGDIVFATKTVNTIAKKFRARIGLHIDTNGRYSDAISQFRSDLCPEVDLISLDKDSDLSRLTANTTLIAPYTIGPVNTNAKTIFERTKSQKRIILTEYSIYRGGKYTEVFSQEDWQWSHNGEWDTVNVQVVGTGIGRDNLFGELKGIYWLAPNILEQLQTVAIEFPSLSASQITPIALGEYMFFYAASSSSVSFGDSALDEFSASMISAFSNIIAEEEFRLVVPGMGKNEINEIIETIKVAEILPQFGKIKFIDLTSGKENFATINASDREITIYYGNLSHLMFLKLMMGTKYPFSVVTGDQSLGEALSLGKFPLYQTLGHKRAILPNLATWMSENGFKQASSALRMIPGIYRFNVDYSLENVENFFKKTTDSETQKSFQESLNKLREDFDLRKNLLDILDGTSACLGNVDFCTNHPT